MKPRINFIFLVGLTMLAGATAQAQQTSRTIPFNNLQTNIAPGTSGQQLTLQLWDAASAGTLLYCENQTLDVDESGAISFVFGVGTVPQSPCSSSPPGLNPADFASGSSRYLDAADTNGNSVLNARSPLTAVAFALSPGPQGPVGPKGDRGDKGDKGDPGAPGAVQTVSSANGSIVVAGTVSNPTVAVASPLGLTQASATPTITGANTGSGNGVNGTSTIGTGLFGTTAGTSGLVNGAAAVLGDTGSYYGVWGASNSNDGVHGSSSSGYGVVGTSISGLTAVYGNGGHNGVFGQTVSADDNGVLGRNDASSAINKSAAGVFGFSIAGWGVLGRGDDSAHGGVTGFSQNGVGVSGLSPASIGVLGGSTSGSGVRGTSQSGFGVFGGSDSGTGVRGESVSGSGVQGEATDVNGIGLYGKASRKAVVGQATGTSSYAVGVSGTTSSPDSGGVEGNGPGFGVVGHSNGVGVLGGDSYLALSNVGVAGSSTNGMAGYFFSFNGTGGVFRSGGSNILVGMNGCCNMFRVDSTGKVFANGGFQGSGADFAESIEPTGTKSAYQPGDVLVIDARKKRAVRLSAEAYSTRVAGIYSTKPGMLASPYEMDDARLGGEIPLAVMGIVPCKVSAENGPIKVGDLLVTSSTPGHAMKGTRRSRMLGAVVGKALEPLPEGKGVIQVLVTLQ